MDNGSAQRDIIPDTYNANNLWGQSDFDVRHIFIANYTYELPFFRGQKGLAGKTARRMAAQRYRAVQTGTPSSVAVGTDYVGVGQDGSMSNAAASSGPHTAIPEVTHQAALNSSSDPHFWFATKDASGNPLFTQPAKGTFVHQDNVRNIIHNPGFHNWNMGLFKKFAITEKAGFQFRAEAFNVLNHPNWSGANFNPTSSSLRQSHRQDRRRPQHAAVAPASTSDMERPCQAPPGLIVF